MDHCFTIELEREDDGRWIAEVVDLPGALVYGDTREKALAAAEAIALRAVGALRSPGRTLRRTSKRPTASLPVAVQQVPRTGIDGDRN